MKLLKHIGRCDSTTWRKWWHAFPLVRHYLVTSMKIRKQRGHHPHTPHSGTRFQLPDIGKAIKPAGGNETQKLGEKAKIEAYPPFEILFVFFLLDSMLSSDVRREKRGHFAPLQCPHEGKRQRVLTRGHRGRPNINYTFVQLWLTFRWPELTPQWKRSSKPSPPPKDYCMRATDCTQAITYCQPN